MKDTVESLGKTEKEFQDKIDFCVSANIPVPPFDLPFFTLQHHFMAGPIPMSLGILFSLPLIFIVL
jgi:hypothetical protein